MVEQVATDYPKVWPLPTESVATQEKTSEFAPQASLHGLIEVRLLSAKFYRFCCLYGSTGRCTYVATLSVGCGQTFG